MCQIRTTFQARIPPIVARPAPLFGKAYIDTMFMPPANGYKYLVQARCSLSHWPEFRMLRAETGKALGDFIFEEILCRWGGLDTIVTDNGKPFIAAMEYLAKRYHIQHIRISGYNSRANGLVERPHYDVRQSLFKAADGEQSKWWKYTSEVFWAERITIRQKMGCSPYFVVTGTEPLMPFDIVEATYLLDPPDKVLS